MAPENVIASDQGVGGSNLPPTLEPREWLRVSDAVRIYSLSRSRIYEMIRDGEIISVSLRKRNRVIGSRRISKDSLDAYFARRVATIVPTACHSSDRHTNAVLENRR
jgi:predicted DNA-binding transcriptional regulator AlpA